MKDLIIVGAGEFAQIAYEYFTVDAKRNVIGFCVNREFKKEGSLLGLPIFEYEDLFQKFPPESVELFVAIPATKFNEVRKKFFLELKGRGYKLATYISSRAFFWRNVEIGENCFIFEDNTIQPFVRIGDNVIMWSGNHIGHRSQIGSHSFLTSHVVVSGYCNIGEGCFLGVNSTFNDKISVANHCVVGAGSLVTKSLQTPNAVYFGSPAKLVEGKDPSSISF